MKYSIPTPYYQAQRSSYDLPDADEFDRKWPLHRLLSTALLAARVALIKSPSDDIVRSVRAVGGRERNYKYRRQPHGHSDGNYMSVEDSSCIAEGIMAVLKVGAPVALEWSRSDRLS